MIGWGAVVALALGAGCYSPSFRDCELVCSAGGACPDGFECATQGVCRPIGMTGPCTTIDASMDGTAEIDASVIPPHPMTTWSTPVAVPLQPGSADEPSLTGDMLELYVNLGNVLAFATRTSPSATWSGLMPADLLNSGDPGVIDEAPYLTADGLTIYFVSTRPFGLGENDVWMSTRTSRTAPWSDPINVVELNSPGNEVGISVSADGLMAVLGSNRDAGTINNDLYVSTRATTTATWGRPQPILELNTPSIDGHPILSPDTLTIYFHSDRPFQGGVSYDIYEAHRSSPTGAFGVPVRLEFISTTSYDADPWVSPDGRTMYITRTSGTGVNTVIHMATR
ncbi:MAG: outer membrane protein OmpA family [Myxococcales bacterium]|nr:outer membrane protein OmpA family [Myxococcales bacterium]